MKNNLLFLLLFPCFIFAQEGEEVETVVISKHKTAVYKGTTQDILDWFIYIDESGMFYMVNLTIPAAEVEEWCRMRKNSQNIFKGQPEQGPYKTLTLEKDNDPGQSMRFYLKTMNAAGLELVSMDDSKRYSFRSIK